MSELRAFHGEQGLKDQYLARVLLHREADELVQGVGYENSNGKVRACGVGCTLDAYDHSRYPLELGIPVELAHLEDRIFESLPREKAMLWPERFLDAPRPGADLGTVWPDFAAWMLEDPDDGVIRFARTDAVRAAISAVAELYRQRVPKRDHRWSDAADAAAYASAAAYAAATQRSAGQAARAKFWGRAADKLIQLMTAAR